MVFGRGRFDDDWRSRDGGHDRVLAHSGGLHNELLHVRWSVLWLKVSHRIKLVTRLGKTAHCVVGGLAKRNTVGFGGSHTHARARARAQIQQGGTSALHHRVGVHELSINAARVDVLGGN